MYKLSLSFSIFFFFRFHESLWQLQNRPDYKVTREVLMVALQNLQYILIKASDNAEFTKATYVFHLNKYRIVSALTLLPLLRFAFQFTRSLYGRRSFNTYTHPTTCNRCRDLQMSPRV